MKCHGYVVSGFLTVACALVVDVIMPASATGNAVSLGDMACQWVTASSALPAPDKPLDFSYSHCDLARSGERAVYLYRPDEWAMLWQLQIASPSTGKVYVESLLSTDRFVSPGSPVFSPDGKWVAFVAATEGKPISKSVRPWVVRTDGTDLRALRSDGWDYGCGSWSPDGRLLACQRTKQAMSDETGAIIGAETVLIDVASAEIVTSFTPILYGPKLSPDGKWLLGGSSSQELVALRLETGERRTLWTPTRPPSGGPSDWGLENYTWGADSDRVLFDRSHRVWDLKDGPYEDELWEASVSKGWKRKVSGAKLLCGSSDGRKLLVDQRNTHQIYARRAAKEAELQPGDLRLLTVESIAPGE